MRRAHGRIRRAGKDAPRAKSLHVLAGIVAAVPPAPGYERLSDELDDVERRIEHFAVVVPSSQPEDEKEPKRGTSVKHSTASSMSCRSRRLCPPTGGCRVRRGRSVTGRKACSTGSEAITAASPTGASCLI
jgi:hypothetical protein